MGSDVSKTVSKKDSQVNFQDLCRTLIKSAQTDQQRRSTASNIRLLTYFGVGVTIAASFLMPRAGMVFGKALQQSLRQKDFDEWKTYNTGYLKQALRRLEKQKLIERIILDGEEALRITDHGRAKVLKYALETINIKKNDWDGKWRIIIYDIESSRRNDQERVRNIFKRIGMYQMQKSVYLFPYPCADEVEYIRSYFELGSTIQYIVAKQIENDEVYREYFGLTG